MRSKPLTFLILALCLLSACTSQGVLYRNTPPSPALAQPRMAPPLVNKASLEQVAGQVVGGPGADQLEMAVKLPEKAFGTQSLLLDQVRYMRIWVRGFGIPAQMWNKEGYVPFNNKATLIVPAIPKGANRIVTAEGYDGEQNPIPGVRLKAFYSSPPGEATVTVTLKWRFVTAAEALEQLLDLNPTLAAKVDANALQSALEKVMYGNTPPGGSQFAVHPSRIDAAAIAAQINEAGGQMPDMAGMAMAPANANLAVRTPQGQPLVNPVTIALDDPASAPVVIPGGGTGNGTVGNITPGTWNVLAKVDGLNGGVQAKTTVTVGKDGSVSLGANPLVMPPVITNLTFNPSPALPAGQIAWWNADGHALDAMGNYHGTLENAPAFTAGRRSRALDLDGINDYVNITAPVADTIESAGTISAWVYRQGNSGGIFTRSTDGTWPGERLVVYFRSDNNTWGWSLGDGISFQTITWPNAAFPANQWVHFALAWDGTTINTYLNGAVHDSRAQRVIPELTGVKTWLGRTEGLLNPYFDGYLDEVLLYNRALSAAEVQAVFNAQDTVTVQGDGFATLPADNNLLLGGFAAPVLTSGPNAMTAALPAGAAGSAGVKVTVQPAAKTSNTGNVNVPPVITGLAGLGGKANDVMTIAGLGFNPTPSQNTVRFNGTQANVTAATNTTLTVTVPAGSTSGAVTVVTNAGNAASAPFTVSAPVIAALNASSGKSGTAITVKGFNFTGATAVRFNGVNAAAFNVVDDQTLSATVPAGATSGQVTVTNAAGTANSGALRFAPPATSCRALRTADPLLGNGYYWVDPTGGVDTDAVLVYCDMTTLGGGWTLVQRTVWLWPGQSQQLLTNYAAFYGNTIGAPAAGSAFRVAGQYWPGLQGTLEHMMVHKTRRTDGYSCKPLHYTATNGTWTVPPGGGASVSGYAQPVTLFNQNAFSTTDNGPSTGCPTGDEAVPWTYTACCTTCPTYKGGYWADTAHPMASYLLTNDALGRNAASECGGDAGLISAGYYGINGMEYYLR